ncbi:MAG: AsmA family protein, partial [Hyphomicrobium sp.]
MNNALLYLGAFFALVLGALFAVPTFIDWNGYRGVFEEQASKVLGRDVRVGGTVNVRFLPAPYVKFEKLRIADMADASGEALFRAESFKLWLSVPPLLRGVFEANQIELKRPVLRLAADKSGGGNWSTLTFAAGNLPFVPNDVTLEQVSVINGSVSLNGSEGVELARIDGINGDLTSETLLGPFKFKGTAKWDGGLRDVRIATAAPEANGDVRFKANVTVAGTKHAYTLDGRVADLKSKPRVEAELTAKLTLANAVAAPAMAQSAADPSKSAPTATSAATAAGFDLRGKVTGDTSGFKCDDIALSLDQAGPPQIVTGAAKMAWTDKVRLDLALQSSWLDLDRATAGTTARPLEVARGLFDTFAGLLPVEAETNVGLNLDQVNFGGEAVSGVRLAVVRAGGPLELKEFRAGVPGGTTVVLDGVLDVASRPAAFQGNASLDGQRMFKFLAWALKRPQLADDRPDQSFSLSGRLMLGEKAVELKAATATIGEQPLKGEMSLVDDVRRRLGLTIEGARIDLGQLFPGSLSLASLAALKTTAADGARTATAS